MTSVSNKFLRGDPVIPYEKDFDNLRAGTSLNTSTTAKGLSAEQIQSYHEHGFTIVKDLLAPSELSAMNAHLDQIVASGQYVRGAGGREGSIHALSLISDQAKQVEQDERILDIIAALVNPGIAVHSSKLVTKLPYAADVCHWHQDDAYFGAACRNRCSVWIPLQDTDESNGCLWFIPGSQLQGLLPHDGRKDWGTCRRSLREEDFDLSKAIPIAAQAGSIVIFNVLACHHSKNNRTAQTRRAFIITYQEASAEKSGAQWRILRP